MLAMPRRAGRSCVVSGSVSRVAVGLAFGGVLARARPSGPRSPRNRVHALLVPARARARAPCSEPTGSGARPTRTLAEVARDHDRSDGARAAVARGLGTLLGTAVRSRARSRRPARCRASCSMRRDELRSQSVRACGRSICSIRRPRCAPSTRPRRARDTEERARFLVAWLRHRRCPRAERKRSAHAPASRNPTLTDRAAPPARPEKLRRRVRARAFAGLTRAAALVPPPLFRASLDRSLPVAAWTRFEGSRARTSRSRWRHAGANASAHASRAACAVTARGSSPSGCACAPARSPTPAAVVGSRDLVELDPSDRAARHRELARGRGALVVTAHIGNWELLAARHPPHRPIAARWSGSRVRTTARRAGSKRCAARYGVETIPQSEQPARDPARARSGRRRRAPLRPRSAPTRRRVPAVLRTSRADDDGTGRARSRRARAALAGAVRARSQRSGRYRLALRRAARARPSRSIDRARTTRRHRALERDFERWIRAAPEQWAWHQPRWRTQPGSGPGSRRQAALARAEPALFTKR